MGRDTPRLLLRSLGLVLLLELQTDPWSCCMGLQGTAFCCCMGSSPGSDAHCLPGGCSACLGAMLSLIISEGDPAEPVQKPGLGLAIAWQALWSGEVGGLTTGFDSSCLFPLSFSFLCSLWDTQFSSAPLNLWASQGVYLVALCSCRMSEWKPQTAG